jgi:hypothetical protein
MSAKTNTGKIKGLDTGLRQANAALHAGSPFFDHWIGVLGSLKAMEGYETVTVGHYWPVDRSAIDSTIAYLSRAKEISRRRPTQGRTANSCVLARDRWCHPTPRARTPRAVA